jgi:hypothetical protein
VDLESIVQELAQLAEFRADGGEEDGEAVHGEGFGETQDFKTQDTRRRRLGRVYGGD